MEECKRVFFKVIEKFYDRESKQQKIKIKCECGNIAIKGSSHIYSGCRTCGNSCPISKELRSKSAKDRDFGGANMLPKGDSGMNRIFDLYKRRAKKKGVAFTLTKDIFKLLTSSDCHYCGEPPSMIYRHTLKRATDREKENSTYVYNSLDRINPNLGYTEENVRPSCKCCNVMKWNHSEDFLKERIKIFYEFYFGKDESAEDHF